MEDMITHFNKNKQYPLRAFCYDYDFNIKHFSIDQGDLNEGMSKLQEMAIDNAASAAATAGMFIIHRGEGDDKDEAVAACKDDPQVFNVLAIIMKFMDGKTFALAREVLEGDILDTELFLEGDQFIKLPLKPWGN